MKLIIFGATGGTGQELVKQGLQEGHRITAYVRNAAALAIQNKDLSVIQGTLTDRTALQNAIAGNDAVISVLGNQRYTKTKSTAISEGLGAIIDAMRAVQVQRIIFVTSFGVSSHVFLPERWFIKIFLKNVFADIPRQEKMLKESGLQWTVVRPARLTDGLRTSHYHSGEDLFIHPLSALARADLADFLLKSAGTAATIGKILTVKKA